MVYCKSREGARHNHANDLASLLLPPRLTWLVFTAGDPDCFSIISGMLLKPDTKHGIFVRDFQQCCGTVFL
jgi:hypothetical protein